MVPRHIKRNLVSIKLIRNKTWFHSIRLFYPVSKCFCWQKHYLWNPPSDGDMFLSKITFAQMLKKHFETFCQMFLILMKTWPRCICISIRARAYSWLSRGSGRHIGSAPDSPYTKFIRSCAWTLYSWRGVTEYSKDTRTTLVKASQNRGWKHATVHFDIGWSKKKFLLAFSALSRLRTI